MEHTTPQRLFIIDGMSLLFRSFYAMGTHLTDPHNSPIGAVYGFLKVFIKILKEQNPTHFAVCWDVKEKTFRHEIYPTYKANRGAPPPEIIPQILTIQNLVSTMGVASFSLPGYEADDLVGSLAKYFEHYGEVFIVSSDKDYMQIVNEKIKLFSLKKGDEYDIIDEQKVIDYFGVPPQQVTQILALTGDSVDNIPGIKGIGKKTAQKLILKYNTIEKIYAHFHEMPVSKTKTLLENKKEDALLFRHLVTIQTGVPLCVTELNMRYDFQKLQHNKNFEERLIALKMHSLTKSVFAGMSQKEIHRNKNVWDTTHYHLVKTQEELQTVFAKIIHCRNSFFALDTETTGLDVMNDLPIGVSLCFEEGVAYYIPAHHCHLQKSHLLGEQEILPEYSSAEVWEGLQKALEKRKVFVVAHNLKFDLHMLKNVNVNLEKGRAACTLVAAWLCNASEGIFNLDFLTLKHFHFQKTPTSALIGKETGRTSMTEVPLKELAEYACQDADATYRLWVLYEKNLAQNNSLRKIFYDMEMPLLFLLVEMERTGVQIDSRYLGKLAAEMQEQLILLEKEIYAIVGYEFKITSPKQLGDVLFEHLKVHKSIGFQGKLARTTQGYKTDASVLEQFESHEVVFKVQQHRELSKLLSTYVLVLPRLVNTKTGRVHTHFNQTGTVTGRLSSSDPNMQNIPVHSNWGKKVRCAFVTSTTQHVLTCADYSQIELRVLAHLSGDSHLLTAFRAGVDIHAQTAAQILGKEVSQITHEERNKAKAINFGILYGMGPQRLAKQEKISFTEAKKFIENYFLNFPGVKAYLDLQKEQARLRGFVQTYFGRMRLLPQITSQNSAEAKFFENIAVNSPVQGTAADIMKMGMIAVQKELHHQGLKTKIILQVHDEIVLEGPLEEAVKIDEILKNALEKAVEFALPLQIDLGHGKNWLEAKQNEPHKL